MTLSFHPQIYDESETDIILNAKYFFWKNYSLGKWGLREAFNQNSLMQLFNGDRRIVHCLHSHLEFKLDGAPLSCSLLKKNPKMESLYYMGIIYCLMRRGHWLSSFWKDIVTFVAIQMFSWERCVGQSPRITGFPGCYYPPSPNQGRR